MDSSQSTMIGVAMKRQERQLLERAAGELPVSTWMRTVSLEVARLVLDDRQVNE